MAKVVNEVSYNEEKSNQGTIVYFINMMANPMTNEPDAPEFNNDIYEALEYALSIPGGVNLHQIIDTVRASSTIMNDIFRKNRELKNNAEKTIADLQTDLFSERQKVIEFQEKFNAVARQLHEISINSYEQSNALKAQIIELTSANEKITNQNRYLQDELRKAHDWLDLIYSTAAKELKVTLDELEKNTKLLI